MSFKIDKLSKRWDSIENKPEALKGCFSYVRDETAHSETKFGESVFYNIDKGAMRCKFVQLACTTLITHTIGVVISFAVEFFHVLTLGYFDTTTYNSFTERLLGVTILMLHALSTPIVLVALQVIAMTGIVAPERARPAYVLGEVYIYCVSADGVECKGYRPLHHWLTLPLHTKATIDNYDAYLEARAANQKPLPLVLQFG